MACKYFLNNRTFNSEVELDDYLLAHQQMGSSISDIVFSKFTVQQENVKAKLKEVKAKNQHEWDLYMQWAADHEKTVYGEDGETDVVQRPYIGVNSYLASLTDPQLFPEFRENNYWNIRYNSWREGIFTDDEKNVLGIDPNLSEVELKEQYKSSTPRELESYSNQIKEKWKAQGRTGDAIHEVFQIYFSRYKGKFGYEQPNVESFILSKLHKKNLPFLPKDSNGQVNIKSIIERANSIRAQLEEKYKTTNLMYFPEFVISDKVAKTGSNGIDHIIGKIDLLIIDGDGKSHILDYKTSIKDEVNSAKELTYKYQLTTYQRILDRSGLDMDTGDLIIAPVKINNFRKEGDSYVYNDVKSDTFIKALPIMEMNRVYDNVQEFLPARQKIILSVQEIQQEVSKRMGENFPAYISDRLFNEKEVTKQLKKLKVFEKKNSNDEYEYKPPEGNEKITGKNEAELVAKVIKFRQSLVPKKARITQQLRKIIQSRINGDQEEYPVYNSARKGSVTWLKDQFDRYSNGQWELLNDDIYDAYGIIALQHKHSKQVDFVRVSTNYITSNHTLFKSNKSFYKGMGISSRWQTDVSENSKSDSLMLEAVNGNIELIELMEVINATDGLNGRRIGRMAVINPYDSEIVEPTNEEALYCYNQLARYNPPKRNLFQDQKIEFASRFEKIHQAIDDIMELGTYNQWKGQYYKFKNIINGCTSLFDNVADDITTQQQIEKLVKLADILKNKFNDLDVLYTDSHNLNRLHVRLYNEINVAIAALKGINFRQQLTDHKKWAESLLIWKKGLSGSYIDNPGNLSSETLNLITKLVTQGYQNVRDSTLRAKKELDKYTKALKEEKEVGYLNENLTLNQVDLYKNLYEEKDGDLFFKHVNDSSLTDAERNYLRYALKVINQNRHNLAPETLQEMELNGDVDYYRVPLARGGTDSLVSARGMMAALREKFRNFSPQYVFEKAQQELEGIEIAERKKDDGTILIYKMTNMFDCGEGDSERRLNLIKSVGIENLERNLETLVLKHQFAYFQQKSMDEIFPLIKASTIHLQSEGMKLNTTLKEDLDYVRDYIDNKILNRSIVEESMQKATKVLGLLRNVASRLTLAFSPVQMIYQPLQGLWQTMSLVARKPDGTEAFTFSHFRQAFSIVYKDLFNFSGKPTLCSRLNELFAINDMDMNQYVERILKNKKGIWNMDNLSMKCSSRPDYYNRMIILVCQMLADGSFKAYSLDKDGYLIYDWKKDARFSKFAQNPTGNSTDKEFNQQKSLFYTMARQFEAEHASDASGSPYRFNLNNPDLPRAYTNQQMESMKNLADNIYGYYSHEKKSLIQATCLGSMWLQFKTYWSGKKNQYLQSGGIKLQGKYVPKVETYTKEDGTKEKIHWYYQVTPDGNVRQDLPPIPDKKINSNYNGPIAETDQQKIAPVMVWQGQWQEGILLTIADIFHNKHIFDNLSNKWNIDDDTLRNCYRSNLLQLGIDLFMFGLVGTISGLMLGDWLEDEKKENKKNRDLLVGMQLAAANIFVYSVRNSFLDFNFFQSIGEPLGQWTPFAFDWTIRQSKNFWNMVVGDTDFYDYVVGIASAGKQYKPIFDALKPDMFRTKQEGGTWESRKAKKNKEKQDNI